MQIETVRFGQLEVTEDSIYTFPQGIPGFEELHQYVLLQAYEALPFVYMQAVEESHLTFLLTDPFRFYPDYEFTLSDEVKGELGIEEEGQVRVWCIVTVKDSWETATLNLQAPLVFNEQARLGKQVILHETSYGPKHHLIQQSASRKED
ncbi:flagellar assembly factor FliW [Paenibacillus sp. J31TS4]|uniref:flagellar assembly protein FliW n=1 Tax=Paenibacillus sp. J31TS4 TaxID=2807195 RepID=UPI001B172765|nr:flagellar assembly protein FliW [Paenibacillus sp. J31TS4]GIP40987.1 flagellar assembly factor FliW [Paenibacillus sp. J31TS4]